MLLGSVISALSKDHDPSLLNSYAHVHALLLRADARLDMVPPNVDGALDDARMASQIAPTEGKVWRILANAEEAGGNVEQAIGALKEWKRVDPLFATKARKEVERLAPLLSSGS